MRFQELVDIVNLAAENALRLTATGDPVDLSVGKTNGANLLFRHGFANSIDTSLYPTFKAEVQEAEVVALPVAPVYNQSAPNTFAGWEMRYKVVEGFESAVGQRYCDELNLTPCGDTPVTKNYANEMGFLSVEVAKVPAYIEAFSFSKCLTDMLQMTGDKFMSDIWNEATGITVSEKESIAKAIIKAVPTLIDNKATEMAIRHQYGDNGAVATITGTLAGLGTGAYVGVNRTDLFLRLGEVFAVYRPDTSDNLTCKPVACARRWTLRGYARLRMFNASTKQVMLDRAYDLDGNLMPSFSLAAGDVLVALAGTYQTISLGGNNYRVITPYWGLPAGITSGYVQLQNCCRYQGLYGSLKLAQEYNNVGLLTRPTTYFGLDLDKYAPYLIPTLLDCCTTGAHAVNATYIYDRVGHAVSILNQMRAMGYLPNLVRNAKIVIQAAPLTMEYLAESILNQYPTWAANNNWIEAANPRVKVMKASEIVKMDFSSSPYPVEMQTVTLGMEEGIIRIGVEKPYVKAVFRDLKEPLSEWNFGNLVKRLPDDVTGTLDASDYERYRNSNVFFKNGGHGSLDNIYVKMRVERALNFFNLLGGTETIVLNAQYRRPDSCTPPCVTSPCPGC